MKLRVFNTDKPIDASKDEELVEQKKAPEAVADETIDPIPGFDKDSPGADRFVKSLKRLKKSNPDLYKKITNWD